MTIYAIRHGLSEANFEGIIQGRLDSPLSPEGRAQAKLLSRFFKSKNIVPERIYSSPLKRALETAKIISESLQPAPPVEAVEGLTEIDVGTLSGMTLEEAYSMYPEEFAPDINRWLGFETFKGESFENFFERVQTAVEQIMSQWGNPADERTVFFVVHAGVMRPLLKTLLNANSDFMYFTFPNCSIVKILYFPVLTSIRRVIESVLTINEIAELMKEPKTET